jgi:hypothetical protein
MIRRMMRIRTSSPPPMYIFISFGRGNSPLIPAPGPERTHLHNPLIAISTDLRDDALRPCPIARFQDLTPALRGEHLVVVRLID